MKINIFGEQTNVWYTDRSKTDHGTDIGVKGPESQDLISLKLTVTVIVKRLWKHC